MRNSIHSSHFCPWFSCYLPLVMLSVWGLTRPALSQTIVPAADGTGTQVIPHANQIDIGGGTRSGENLFHSFQQFGLGSSQIANFLANPEIQRILARVVGGEASRIDGLLQVTGGAPHLYLLNPAGIIFGPQARLDVPGSFTATTASGIGFGQGNWTVGGDPANYSQLLGAPTSLQFATQQPGSLVNLGDLSVQAGKDLHLSAGMVINAGTLIAPAGQITVMAVPHRSLVRLSQPNSLLSLEVTPLMPGAIAPTALTPATLPQLLTGGGQSHANQVTANPDGSITIAGQAPVPMQAGTALIAGQVNTTGHTGGSITLTGERVTLMDVNLNASGQVQGGQIRIGGDQQGLWNLPTAQFTYVSPGSRLQADALYQGNGGKIIVWADDTSQIYGHISAQAGPVAGNGGFVETSGRRLLQVTQPPNISASNGLSGTWLIDPYDITIVAGSGALGINPIFPPFEATGSGATIGVDLIISALVAGGNVTLSTGTAGTENGDIFWNAPLSVVNDASRTLNINAAGSIAINQAFSTVVVTSGTNLFNLNLSAGNGVFINQPIVGELNLTIAADSDNNGTGVLSTNAPIVLNGGNFLASAADVAINAPIQSGQGTIQIIPSQSSSSVGLGTGAPGTLALSLAEFNNLQTLKRLTIGSPASTGTVTLDTVNLTTPADFTLYGGDVVFQQTLQIANDRTLQIIANNLIRASTSSVEVSIGGNGAVAISAVNGIGDDARFGVDAQTLAARSTTGDILLDILRDNAVVDTVAGISGISTSNGQISLQNATNQPANLQQPIVTTGAGDILIFSNASGSFNLSSTITAAGDITLEAPLQLTSNSGLSSAGLFTLDAPITSGPNRQLTLTVQSLLPLGTNQIDLGANSNLIINLNTLDPIANPAAGTLQNAIAVIGSTPNTTINLGSSTYREPLILDTSGSLTVRGNGATILDGNNSFEVIRILSSSGDVTLDRLVIQNGLSTKNSRGGGITNRANLTILNSEIRNHRANFGGGIYNTGALTIIGSLLQGNQANESGGGIFNAEDSILSLSTTTVAFNRAIEAGGGLFNDEDGQAILDRSTFNNNQADSGAGIANNGDLILQNSTLSGNRARDGGGGLANQPKASANILNSTITQNNSGRADGGGIENRSTQPINIQGTIVAENQSNTTGKDVRGDFFDWGNNLIGVRNTSRGFFFSQTGTTNNPIVPLLAPLGNYGGPTQTHALLPGSPAIDGGSPLNPLATDQRGINRVGLPDIGAFESRGFVFTGRPTGSDQSSAIAIPFAAPLTVNVASLFGEPVQGGKITFTPPPATTATAVFPGSPIPGTPFQATIVNDTAIAPATAGPLAGSYTVTATARGLSATERFSLTNQTNFIVNSAIDNTTQATNHSANSAGGMIAVGETPSGRNPNTVSSNSSSPNTPGNQSPTNSSDANRGSSERRSGPAVAPILAISSQVNNTIAQVLEFQLSQDYAKYLQLPAPKELTPAQIQSVLQQVQRQHGQKFAVIYAMFLPASNAGAPAMNPFDPLTYSPSQLLKRLQQPRPDDQLTLFLLTSEGSTIMKPAGVTRSRVMNQGRLLKIATADPEDDRSYKPLARQFYGWLLKPLEPELQRLGITNLVYSLDKGLRTLPLAVMMDGPQFVIERYAISVVPSIGLTDVRITSSTPQTALLMGMAEFQTMQPLPGVPTELQTVGEQMNIREVWLNQNFTLANLLHQTSNRQPQILHLATHAVFNAGSPELSYIQMWDQRLTMKQMRALNWGESNLALLTLSACTTALGSPESELGFTGLAANAGIRTAMGSLWTVSDAGTLALMTEFYAHLRKAPVISTALQAAQLRLLRGETRLERDTLVTSQGRVKLPPELHISETATLQHPFFWSAFTLVGTPW